MKTLDITGHSTLQVVGDDALGEFATEILGESPTEILGDNPTEILGMGQWLHKLNPTYWFKSKDEQEFLDAEKRYGKANVAARKELENRQKALSAAERAEATAAAAREAEAQSAAINEKLKTLKAQVSGAFVGGDASSQASAAEAMANIERVSKGAQLNAHRSGALAVKLEAGEKLTPDELNRLRHCLKMCHHLKALHDALHAKAPASTSGYRGPDYIEPTAPSSSFLGNELEGEELMGSEPLGEARWVALISLSATQPVVLRRYMAKHKIKLNPEQTRHLMNMRNLTLEGIKRQKQGLWSPPASKWTQVARTWQAKGDDSVLGAEMGLSFGSIWGGIKKVATVATFPIAAVAYGTYKAATYAGKGVMWTGRKIFGGGKGGNRAAAPPSPGSESNRAKASRQARIKALRRRRQAAMLRQRAATLENEEARREAQAAAEAADAEAQAQEAEAQAQDAASTAEDADAGPAEGDGGDSSEGDFVGAFVGANAFVGAWTASITDPRVKKIVDAAGSDTVLGKKIRAGAAVARASQKGSPRAKAAVKKMTEKAAHGNVQATSDLRAVKAGAVALRAKKLAHIKQAIVARKKAADAKGIAARKKLEAVVASKLARGSRRRALVKVARVEKKAAAGHAPSKALIAKTIAKAKTGNKKAKTAVAALKVARSVRLASKTPRQAKNLRAASKMAKKVLAGNKSAIQHVAVIKAAAAKGQQNAKRAMARLHLAAQVEKAVRTGHIVPKAKKGHSKASTYAHLRKKAIKPGASREDVIAAARAANNLGLKSEAAELAHLAQSRPSATAQLKQAATVAAAAKLGSEADKAKIENALAKAEAGEPAGIKAAGQLAAVQTLQAVKTGAPMSPQVAEATHIFQRADAGDPAAQRTIERASTAAESGDKNGVKAAVALTAASTLLAATATRPDARRQLLDKANEAQGLKLQPGEVQQRTGELNQLVAKVRNGEASREEAERARKLAMSLNQPAVAAEISALTPPLDLPDPRSSLPDEPLPPITTTRQLVKEVLRAVLFATKDPIQNYREGVQSRGAGSTPVLEALPSAPATAPVTTRGAARRNPEAIATAYKNKGASRRQTAMKMLQAGVPQPTVAAAIRKAYGG